MESVNLVDPQVQALKKKSKELYDDFTNLQENLKQVLKQGQQNFENTLQEIINNDLSKILKKLANLIQLHDSKAFKKQNNQYVLKLIEQRKSFIQGLNLEDHKFQIKNKKSYEIKVDGNIQFDRIKILNEKIFTASQYESNSRLLDSNFKMKKELELKARIIHQKDNKILAAHNDIIKIIEIGQNNEENILKTYQVESQVQKITDLNEDIFICGLKNGEIQLFSMSQESQFQSFKIEALTSITEICLIKKKHNYFKFAFANKTHGIVIGKIIQRGLLKYELIDQQIIILQTNIRQIMHVNKNTLAFIRDNRRASGIKTFYLNFYSLNQNQATSINEIKLDCDPNIFAVEDYDYDFNPFAFVRDDEKISLINMRNYQIVKIMDSKYEEKDKSGCLINTILPNKSQLGQFYKLIYIQIYKGLFYAYDQIAETHIRLP